MMRTPGLLNVPHGSAPSVCDRGTRASRGAVAACGAVARPGEHNNGRILVVDDSPNILEDFRKTLCVDHESESELAALAPPTCGIGASTGSSTAAFQVTFAHQGREALELVRRSVGSDEPYAMAFVDMRMPPGWDGLETVERLLEVDPELQIVICTAYSDHSWSEIRGRLRQPESILVLKKPFENIEIMQMAAAVTGRWRLRQQLLHRVDEVSRIAAEHAGALKVAKEQLRCAENEGVHNSDLTRRNVELLELHRFRNELSAMLVHDLKNPLSVILSSLEFASETLAAIRIDADTLSAIEDSRSAGHRMLQLLGNLLTVSSAEAGRLQLRQDRVSLRALLSGIVSQRRSVMRARGIAASVALVEDYFVTADTELLTRAVENIVDDAVRNSPSGGLLILSVERVGDGTVMSIGTSGPPIPKEARLAIFEKYAGVSGVAGRMNLGLGLYFCRLVAEAHGGRIWVDETSDLPTVFRFLLPLVACDSAGS